VVEWKLKSPDRSALEWLAEDVTTMATEQVAALFSAVAGSHMRSLLVAHDALAHDALLRHTTPSVASALLQVEERMGQKLEPNELASARDYVIRCMVDKSAGIVPSDVESISDNVGTIPPAVMCLAFGVKLDDMSHPLLSLLTSFSIYIDPYTVQATGACFQGV
jgi:hypothetical protein